jgi:hypothetical protein
MQEIYQGVKCQIVGNMDFEGSKVRIISIIGPRLLLIHCTENWKPVGRYIFL